ncbi:hypothetical protein K504DRAFT_499136 [Pleomassaria siparia CBS 279.74]|uniref:Uncharacterized protein n=1 Tax=Pleomassaria siparia CBS 279.74 TaxID=1314801 RepID=A0A6G1KHR6_9PLEO|nr:hypothetical protein K504DRAFT_499136 [Pleomassaria siparia CBS 279.74]
MSSIWTALIRTHHITSRKKVGKLRSAASNHDIYALLRSGGCPGIMYCEGSESGVKDWVADVQRLRYKDFQLVKKAAEKQSDDDDDDGNGGGHGHGRRKSEINNRDEGGRLEEVGSVKEFGACMAERGVTRWWRNGMGYVHDD